MANIRSMRSSLCLLSSILARSLFLDASILASSLFSTASSLASSAALRLALNLCSRDSVETVLIWLLHSDTISALSFSNSTVVRKVLLLLTLLASVRGVVLAMEGNWMGS